MDLCWTQVGQEKRSQEKRKETKLGGVTTIAQHSIDSARRWVLYSLYSLLHRYQAGCFPVNVRARGSLYVLPL